MLPVALFLATPSHFFQALKLPPAPSPILHRSTAANLLLSPAPSQVPDYPA